ncbi:MAG: DegV family protein [Chloroflexi bacterium]|nr:DegV family protein [Chloroflexota bacterium]
MQRSVAIVTDSTADLPAAHIREYDITVVPLSVLWEGRTYREGVDLTPEEFYARLDASASLPSTSHPNPETFAEVFRSLAYSGREVYGLFLSARFSATYQAARQAAQEIPGARIVVEDSQTTSMALGFQVLAAARAAQRGESLEQVRAAAARARERSGILFVPRTLAYMRRGGRLGPLQYHLATALRILPVMEIREGGPVLVTRMRTFRRAVERMIDEVVRRTHDKPNLRLALLHAAAPEMAAGVEASLLTRLQPIEVIRQIIGPVLGIHTGPGLVGVAYQWEEG